MSEPFRQNFATLCRAIRAGDVTLLECRNVESQQMMYAICVTKRLPDGQVECIPLARLLEHHLGSVVLPPPPSEATQWRNELN